MVVECVANSAPFARDGYTRGASVELYVDLRMTSSNLSSALRGGGVTMQRTMASSV